MMKPLYTTRRNFIDFLNNESPEKWVGRGGPIRSPDLINMDFLWGYEKLNESNPMTFSKYQH